MRDCVNAEVRDRLPELVHGLLDEPEHAAVEAHVAECPECAAEAALIRLAASSVALGAPRMDAARIAGALPPPLPAVSSPARSIARGPVIRWAAALLVVATGVGLLQVTTQNDREGVASVQRTLPASGERAIARPMTDAGTAAGYAVASGRTGLVLVGGIDALTLDQLEDLASGVESLSYMPAADPDPAMFPANEDAR